jgi:hypothetical protein
VDPKKRVNLRRCGMRCPVCNPCDEVNPPEMPAGFVDDDAALA